MSGAVRTNKKCILSPFAGYMPAPVMEAEIGINIAVDGGSGDVDVLTEVEEGINLKVGGDGEVEIPSIDVPLKLSLQSVQLDSEVHRLFSEHVLALPLSAPFVSFRVLSWSCSMFLPQSIHLTFLVYFSLQSVCLFCCSYIALSRFLLLSGGFLALWLSFVRFLPVYLARVLALWIGIPHFLHGCRCCVGLAQSDIPSSSILAAVTSNRATVLHNAVRDWAAQLNGLSLIR